MYPDVIFLIARNDSTILYRVNLPYVEIPIGQGIETMNLDENEWHRSGFSYLSKMPQSNSQNNDINIETERYFQRVWINESKDVKNLDTYECEAYVYNNTLIKWVYRFEYPTDIVDIYEQLIDLTESQKSGKGYEVEIKKLIKQYKYGLNSSAKDEYGNKKESETPYIELSHWDRSNYKITFRCADLVNTNNNNYFEVIYALFQKSI